MGNTFVTLKEIARQALPQLMDNLVFPQLCYRDFGADCHDLGDTVQVRRPAVFSADEFNQETGVNYRDICEDGVDVTLDHIATVDARATSSGVKDSCWWWCCGLVASSRTSSAAARPSSCRG